MHTLNATELAATLNLSKGRISQLVSDGRLDGCYIGDGRARRFDPDLVARRLKGALDQGQMLGNGASTGRAIASVLAESSAEAPIDRSASGASDGRLSDDDTDGYRMARQAKLAEEVRRIRRQNELDEGTMVLVSEVERQVARVLRQEIAEVEEALRTGARAVADKLGVDFRAVRQILLDVWRKQRHDRSLVLSEQASGAVMTQAEEAADI
jgi:hypothetical protein